MGYFNGENIGVMIADARLPLLVYAPHITPSLYCSEISLLLRGSAEYNSLVAEQSNITSLHFSIVRIGRIILPVVVA